MASLVVTRNEFDHQVNQSGLAPGLFKYRFLVEGDSWMDRSSLFSTSLIQCLAIEFDKQKLGDALFINVSRFGDTIKNMGRCASGEFGLWIATQFAWKFDAILLSGGGNDFIDAAREPAPDHGILVDFSQSAAPNSSDQCIRKDAVAALITGEVDPGFGRLYDVVQGSQYANIPIFLNNYDVPTPRFAPAAVGGKAWLSEAYSKNAIPPALWQDVTDQIFIDMQMTIASWAWGRPNVHIVPTDGTLTKAAPGTTGDSNDWLNEIHPNQQGWRKLAKVWTPAIKAVCP